LTLNGLHGVISQKMALLINWVWNEQVLVGHIRPNFIL
jgi:hypothetical protein